MICKNQSWYLSLAALVNHQILRDLLLLGSALVPLAGRLCSVSHIHMGHKGVISSQLVISI